MRTTLLRSASIALLLALTSNAIAQTAPASPSPAASPAAAPAPNEANKEEAKTRFKRGVQLYTEGAFEAALAEFLRSRELYATRSNRTNVGYALKKLKRFDEALDALEAVQKDFPDGTQEERDALAKEVSDLRQLIGFVDIRSSEADANIVLDGTSRGKSPLSGPVRVGAGSHVIRVSKEGFLPFEMRVDVAGKQTVPVEAKLGALTKAGRLAISEDRGAKVKVLVDGAEVGTAPWEGTLPVGPHVVTLQGEGNIGSPPSPVTINLNQLSRMVLIAEPLECELRVSPTPANATVSIDSVELGRGVWKGPLRCGGHLVEIAEPGFLPLKKQVSLTKGTAGSLTETLERDPESEMWKAKNPPRVTIDARAGLLLAPSLAGDLNGSKSLGLGAMFTLSGGYRLGSGIGAAVDASYITLSQKITGSAQRVTSTGIGEQNGTSDDQLKVSGPAVGLSAALSRGEKVVFGGRLGVGVFFAAWSDARSNGQFVTPPPGPQRALGNTPYSAPDITEKGTAPYVYIAPEVNIGYRFSPHFVATVGADFLLLIAMKSSSFPDTKTFLGGTCPVSPTNDCLGQTRYVSSSVLGSFIPVISPTVDLRFEF